MSAVPQRVHALSGVQPSDHKCCVTCLDAACESCILQCSTCDFTFSTYPLVCKRLYLKAQSISLVEAFACSLRCGSCQCVSRIAAAPARLTPHYHSAYCIANFMQRSLAASNHAHVCMPLVFACFAAAAHQSCKPTIPPAALLRCLLHSAATYSCIFAPPLAYHIPAVLCTVAAAGHRSVRAVSPTFR